jgi:cell division septum initiation protein DivIVA
MAGAIPDIVIRLTGDVDAFIRAWNEAARAAEQAAARIRAAGAAAGDGPDPSRFRDLNAELERLTRTARQAADAIREHGNASRRAGQDTDELGRRIRDLNGNLGRVGSSAMSAGAGSKLMQVAWAALASILPGIIAGIFALGAALTGIVLAAGVAVLGARGLGQAFDRLQATIAPLQRQLDSLFRSQLGQEMAKLGQTITSELTPAFKGVAGAIADLIKDTTQWIRSSDGISTIKQAMSGVQDLVRELSPAVKGLVQIFLEFAASAAPSMGKIGQAISEVVTRIRDLFREANKTGQLTRIFEAGAEAVKGFGQIVEGLIAILLEMADQGGQPAAQAMKNLGQAMKDAAPAIGALFANLARAAEVITTVIKWIAKLGDVLADVINPLRALEKAFPGATKGMETFTKSVERIGASVGGAGKEIQKFGQTVQKGMDKVAQDTAKALAKAGQEVVKWATKMASDAKSGTDKTNQAIKQGFDKANQAIKQAVDKMVQDVKAWWDKTVADVGAGVDRANQALKAGIDKMIQDFKASADKFFQAGKDMVDGLIKGAKAKADELVNTFKEMAEKALAAAKAALGIHSPSQVFADEVGIHIPAGIAQGIKAGAPALNAALAASMRGLPTMANVALSGAAGRMGAISAGGAGRQVVEVKLAVGSGGDGAVGTMIGGLARRGQLKITANAVVGGR